MRSIQYSGIGRIDQSSQRIEDGVKRYSSVATGTALAVLLCLPLILTGCSQEEPATEAFTVLQEEYREGASGIETAEEFAAHTEAFTPRFEELAVEYWGTEAALDARIWVLGRLGSEQDEEARNAALVEMTDAIFDRYERSTHMEKLANLQRIYPADLRAKYFGDLQENSPHASVRAAVIYAAARNAEMELTYGDAFAGGEVDREAAMKLRKSNLELLVAEYADVPLRNTTYGATAETMLSAHDPSDLEIGKQAPEIIGVDVDGEEMMLSDYLGKVVVLDFWGDW